ncbi:hypothetical protein GQ457_15G019830 [Hibiscus cannabinus]
MPSVQSLTNQLPSQRLLVVEPQNNEATRHAQLEERPPFLVTVHEPMVEPWKHIEITEVVEITTVGGPRTIPTYLVSNFTSTYCLDRWMKKVFNGMQVVKVDDPLLFRLLVMDKSMQVVKVTMFELSNLVKRDKTKAIDFLDLHYDHHRKVVFLGSTIFSLKQPHGVNVSCFISSIAFKNVGGSSESANICVGITNWLGSIAAMLLVDELEMKALVITSFSFTVVTMETMSIYMIEHWVINFFVGLSLLQLTIARVSQIPLRLDKITNHSNLEDKILFRGEGNVMNRDFWKDSQQHKTVAMRSYQQRLEERRKPRQRNIIG